MGRWFNIATLLIALALTAMCEFFLARGEVQMWHARHGPGPQEYPTLFEHPIFWMIAGMFSLGYALIRLTDWRESHEMQPLFRAEGYVRRKWCMAAALVFFVFVLVVVDQTPSPLTPSLFVINILFAVAGIIRIGYWLTESGPSQVAGAHETESA